MIEGEGGLAPKPILATLCFYYLPACFVTHHIFVSWRSSSLDRQTDRLQHARLRKHPLVSLFPSWLLGRRKMPETENSSSSMRNDEK